jgi:hypothetical protein
MIPRPPPVEKGVPEVTIGRAGGEVIIPVVMRFLGVWVAAFVLVSTSMAETAPVTDRFHVDAAVAGVVRRDLRDIGKAALQYVPLGDKRFRLKGAADVVHSRKRKHYRFQLDMTVELAGHRLRVAENLSRFDGDAAEVREQVERVVPFLYLVRMLPPPGPTDEPSRTWLARHGLFVLRYERRETLVEASLHQDDALVARFEITPRGSAAPLLERVSIPTTEQVTVRFTLVKEKEKETGR